MAAMLPGGAEMGQRRYVMGRRLQAESCADFGTPERWQHSAREWVGTTQPGVLAAKALEECALDHWLRAGAIAESEHAAGLRLREDYQQARLSLLVQRAYDGVRAPSPGAHWSSPAERRTALGENSLQAWRKAVRAVGMRASVVLIAVCCEDAAIAWHRRSELRQALRLLEAHYGGHRTGA